MNRLFFRSILFIAFLAGQQQAFANHVFGGELLYKYVSGNTYALTLTLYGDCGTANPLAFNVLPVDTPLIRIYHGNHLDSFHVHLHPIPNNGIEVSPVCPGQLNNTTCHGGSLPGVTKFIYTDTVTLNTTAADWHFLFDGVLSDSTAAGRSSNITNVYGAGSTNVYLEATLNNVAGPNSSADYTTIPTPFYTLNIAQQYNQGAVDPDNDSLAFDLVDALTNGNPVSYYTDPNITLSGAYPIITDSGQFSFNPLNGQLSFKPSVVQNALVVGRVTEYKNGIIVGTSKREMTFVVLNNLVIDNVQNTNAVNVSGGNSTGNNVINLCVGSPSISFDINPVDTANNSIVVSNTSLPTNASLTIQNNNTTTPSIHFSWNTSAMPVGVYNFFISYKNNACPIATTQTIAYTVNIVKPYEFVSVSQTATHCYYNADVTVVIKSGVLPADITISRNGNPVFTRSYPTDTMLLSLPAGIYTAVVSAPGIPTCSVPFGFTVVDSGDYPLVPVLSGTFKYCVRDSATVLIANVDQAESVQWYNAAGDSIPTAPIPNTDSPGVYTWYVTEKFGPCSSAKENVTVTVFDKPQVDILSEQGTVCVGEVIYLEATGAKNYDWQPYNKIYTDITGRQFIRVYEPSVYTLYAHSENGCEDSLKLSYNKVEPCCHFTYPDAFTPNGDGKNDRFHALVNGNMEYYELSIYDRWGKRVFWSTDKDASWDGTYNGRPCGMDVYFYRVHAICATGHEEDRTGPLQLLR